MMIFVEWSLPIINSWTICYIFSPPSSCGGEWQRGFVGECLAYRQHQPIPTCSSFPFSFFSSHNKKETNFIIILFPLHLKAWYVCCWNSISISNISVTESYRIREWVRLEGSSHSASLLKSGHPKVHWSGFCLGCSWISPVNETPQPLWVVCSSIQHSKDIIPHIQVTFQSSPFFDKCWFSCVHVPWNLKFSTFPWLRCISVLSSFILSGSLCITAVCINEGHTPVVPLCSWEQMICLQQCPPSSFSISDWHLT